VRNYENAILTNRHNECFYKDVEGKLGNFSFRVSLEKYMQGAIQKLSRLRKKENLTRLRLL
jgi:hypothetical protein